MIETANIIKTFYKQALKAGEPGILTRLTNGRTTEGTLGRWSSTIANCTWKRVGGGVLLNFNKLAALCLAHTVPEEFFKC